MIKVTFKKLLVFFLLFFCLPTVARSFSINSVESFNIESSYDYYSRHETNGILYRVSDKALFYIEEDWLEELDSREKSIIDDRIYNLSLEFEKHIYPKMISTFGTEPEHTTDKSGKISILFHRMPLSAGGYFNTTDQYSVFQATRSNERNIIYLNASYIENDLIESLVAHEFMHLITFNQKEKNYGVKEEVWLNEARAEYAPSFLGYDDIKNSNIDRRLSSFLKYPNIPITEWENREGDYGVINIFVQYLVDHYGLEILIDSFNSEKIGIESINEALSENEYQKTFNEIFTDWIIAVLVNDCSLGEKYCYNKDLLEDIKITPAITHLPFSYNSSFSAANLIKNWSGNWYKIIGGKGDLFFEFEGKEGLEYKIPYLVCDKNEECKINFLELDENNKGFLNIVNFSEEYSSFTFIPSLQSKITDFNGLEKGSFFNWRVYFQPFMTEEKIEFLLNELKNLEEELKRLEIILKLKNNNCNPLTRDLYFGLNGSDVICLQNILKLDGSEIYPEGFITGNFLNLTKAAVIRFQEKYSSEILEPIGLTSGTGYVGEMTRKKINNILR
jgi:hypothetical protein